MFIERRRLIPEPGSFRSATPLSPINRTPELSRVLLSIDISSLRDVTCRVQLDRGTRILRVVHGRDARATSQSFLSQFDGAKHCARFIDAFLKLLRRN